MDETSQRLHRLRQQALLPLSFLALAGIGIVAVIGIVEPAGSPGILESLLAASVVVNIFYYLQSGNDKTAAEILVGIVAVFLVSTTYIEAASRVGEYWLIILPFLAYLLLGRYIAGLFTIGAAIGLIPAMFLSSNWELRYSAGDLASVSIAMLVVAFLMTLYDRSLRRQPATKSVNRASHDETANLKREVAQRENAEMQMADALRMLEENNEKLERITAIDEATISSIGEAVLIVDPEGIVIRANPSSGRVLGINQEDILDKQITDSLMFAKHTDESNNLTPDQVVILQSIQHRSIDEETYKITRPSGAMFYAQMTASPLVVGGEVYGAVVVVRDVTEEVAVDKSKSEFVSIASHQLRTPLSTINWYLEMVISGDFGELNAEQKEFIQEAYSASKRMGDLINALLNASRLDVGVVAVEPKENVDIRDVLKGVITDIEARLTAKDTTIKEQIDGSVVPMKLDARIMEIIFLNLLTNAIKYSPAKSTIDFKAHIDNENLVIEVVDHGYGIPEADKEKIFSKMFRAQNAVEQEPDGNGLGLYIMKSILEALDGSIEFESQEGEGTTFTVKIPKTGMEAHEGAKQLSLDPSLN